MLKQIPIARLRLGMYIHRFDAPWLKHPFWKKRFLLEKYTDLQTIRANHIETVWIDTSKGLDELPTADSQAGPGPLPRSGPDRTPARRQTRQACAADRQALLKSLPSTLEDEYQHARALCDEAHTTVAGLFERAQTGLSIDPADVEELVGQIHRSVQRHPFALISVVRMRTADEYTYMHSVAVCALMNAFSRVLGMTEAQQLEASMAGLLHDVGKMAIPQDILNKPGRLDDDEFNLIRTHPDAGYAMLIRGGLVPSAALDVCLHHHEKFDGSGYPHGLAGDGISAYARMGALCDVYDAVTSNRPYKKGWNPADAIHRMAQWHGHFDPTLLRAFVRTVGVYPVGSLVVLQSGELAVVTEQHPHELLLPKIKLLTTSSLEPGQDGLLDLSALRGRKHIRTFASPDEWDRYGVKDLWLPTVAGAANITYSAEE